LRSLSEPGAAVSTTIRISPSPGISKVV
jgi:hypothetical protein